MQPRDFGHEFTWGVAHAAYQVEGAWDADGKGPSIWDAFSHRRGLRRAIRDGSNGDVACDFYHRYREDTALVAGLGFDAQRFSVSWPRVLPEGRTLTYVGRRAAASPATGSYKVHQAEEADLVNRALR